MKKLTLLLLFAALYSCQKTDVAKDNTAQQEEAVIISPKTDLPTSAKPTTTGTQLIQYANDGAPIILVHGFLGFGRDEISNNFKYWGGKTDLQEVLKAGGYPTFTASVGPVSSNYDRAIELYYQIKGGCVDYGKFHSQRCKHLQKTGKCYTGFYPQWDAQHPVHLIGHSMGGQTIRLLVGLLEKGDALEASASEHSAVFDGYKNGWVKSATTISSPNQGTTLVPVLGKLTDFLKDGITAIAGIAGANTNSGTFYDFDLEQWGLKREVGESYADYHTRVRNSSIWTNTKDLSLWDLSPEGALEMNNFIGNTSSTYFFSICTKATHTGVTTGWEYPTSAMNLLLQPLAMPKHLPFKGIGNFTQSGAGLVTTDKSWWANDGVVNTVSMAGPIGSTNVTYAGQTPIKGVWYNKLLNGYDHLDITGISLVKNDLKPLYLQQAAIVTSLPR